MASADTSQTLRSRFAAILFADVSGSTRLYETFGDTVGHRTVRGYVEMMREATERHGGRVVKTIGDEIMAVFATADAAARAAVDMQAGAERLPEVGGEHLRLRIGFHGGPVLQKDDDVFGDTVNLAARLVGEAQGGQILLSRHLAPSLAPELRVLARDLYGVQVRGKADEIPLSEIVWKGDADKTVIATLAGSAPREKAKVSVLKLKYKSIEVTRRRDNESEVIGREPDCIVQVADHMASRRHCTIERRKDKWVLKDHSTNGTWVTVDGEVEVALRREEVVLRKHGWIAFGQSRAGNPEVVEFFID